MGHWGLASWKDKDLVMDSLKKLAVAGAVLFGMSATAFAADLPPPPMLEAPAPELRGSIGSGWYLRGDIGVGLNNHKPGLEFTSNGAPTAPLPAGASFTLNDFRLGSSTLFGAGVGYQFNSWFRADLTGELRTSASIQGRDTFLFPFGGGSQFGQRQTNNYSGSLSSQVYLANAYADLGTFCPLGCITPFVGAGIGFANHKLSQISDTSVQGPYNVGSPNVFTGQTFAFNTYFAEKSRTNLAWALMAGVGVDVTKNIKLELGYRYLNMGRAETGYAELSGLAGNAPGLQMRIKDLDSHDFRMGMRWMLNGDCCAAPVAAYAPPPPPQPMVRKF
jgi:opacity protein-like surface antigen